MKSTAEKCGLDVDAVDEGLYETGEPGNDALRHRFTVQYPGLLAYTHIQNIVT